MTDVYLYGALGRRFGWRWKLDVQSPAEAVRALCANFPTFRSYLMSHSKPGYYVVIGDESVDRDGLHYPVGRQCIKIVPVVAGAEKPGWVNILIGVIIIIVAVVAWQPELVGLAAGGIAGQTALVIGAVGASLVIAGASQMLSSNPNTQDVAERPENKPSHLFNGPVNTLAQGHPVPVGYGRLRIGSAVISAFITTDEIAVED